MPIFVVEESNDPSSLLKKLSAWSMGGFWLGGTHMKPNPAFMRDVQQQIPKDARIIVTCQKGLRCAAAAACCKFSHLGTLCDTQASGRRCAASTVRPLGICPLRIDSAC